jgi:phosphoribosylformylglycinamidine synthase
VSIAEPGPSVGTDEGLHRALGLTDDEAAAIQRILGRPANPLELAMYAVMWSEHCSYKSSRTHLGRFPVEAPWVLLGPGENAGVIDVGDGLAVALRIESHNHPSAIEPYQGAATGAGGILRDIFTMGARPVALLDSLHFGPLDHPRSRWILDGVVSGISGYGNSVGVPTVGGELAFAPCFAENPLVNVMCVGIMPRQQLVLARASDEGDLAVLLGSATGRDGIGGVSVLASAGFGDDAEDSAAKRPSVQVGDPYEEKRLIEACLGLYADGLVAGIQDLGGAGLTCATSETASRGGMGMDVDVRAVPLRQPAMTPAEIMTSESQERMLAIVRPGDLDAVLTICRRWEVRATVVGRVTAGGRLRLLDGFDGALLADVPAASLHEDAPRYERPMRPPVNRKERLADEPVPPRPENCRPDLLAMLSDSSWVWSQYDHELFLNTVEGPGADATVLRLRAPGIPGPRAQAAPQSGEAAGAGAGPNGRALAITVDSNSRWCALDPRQGAAMLVAEATLNVACTGARPLAVVDCLNFGNPEHPEVMWQLSEAIDGISSACRALSLPVVGGNVSLYNESAGRDIDPTPVVGLVGLIDVLDRRPPGVRLVEGGRLVVLGPSGSDGLAGSRWAWQAGQSGGRLPALDFDVHGRVCELVRGLAADGLLAGVHDIADGGLGLALAEMAVISGTGFSVAGLSPGALFSEAPSRVVACVMPDVLAQVRARAADAGVALTLLGRAGGDRLHVEGLLDGDLHGATAVWRDALPAAMSAV